MSTAPKVSVIIPCYNIEKYIRECLDSVLAQTFSDFECICINDGSTDTTLQILKEYAVKDPRIHVIDQKNSGGSAARNTGLDKAQGDYISFLDNDDLYHPQYLEILYHYAQTNDADISVCNYGVFLNDTPVDFKKYNLSAFDSPKLITKRPFYDYIVKKKKIHMLMWTKLYRKEILKNIRFDLTLPAINDILFNLETLRASRRAVTCKYNLIMHRILASSQTSKKITVQKITEYKDLIYAVNNKIAVSLEIEKEKKYLKLFNTKNAYYNFVYSLMTFNTISASDDVFETVLNALNELELKKLINPNDLKFQDRLIYQAFKGRHLKIVRILMRLRKILTH